MEQKSWKYFYLPQSTEVAHLKVKKKSQTK